MSFEIKHPPTIEETRNKKLGELSRQKIYQEIEAECQCQDAASFSQRVLKKTKLNKRTRLIKAAALAVASIERLDRMTAKE
jgi:hypothetical protein